MIVHYRIAKSCRTFVFKVWVFIFMCICRNLYVCKYLLALTKIFFMDYLLYELLTNVENLLVAKILKMIYKTFFVGNLNYFRLA